MEQDEKIQEVEEKRQEEPQTPQPAADAVEPDSRRGWYVIHALSGWENKVKEAIESRAVSENLSDVIHTVLIPTENVSEVKGGKKRVTTRKFFPGYIFIDMTLTDDVYYFLKDIQGVIGFIGNKPVPLTATEVNNIMTQIDDKKEKVKPKVLFDKGEVVKVNEGPFVNFTGTVEESHPERGKLKIMVSIFGRATPLELEYWQVERT